MVYDWTDEPKNPYQKVAQWPSGDPKKEETKENAQLMMAMMDGKIKSMALNQPGEDTLIFTTENN